MKRRFFTLDVFTDRRFAGNPLAVVLDAAGLDETAMQRIAREFNISETAFVLPATDASHRARARIFTPKGELPFAGHPTVGIAVLLACLDGGDKVRPLLLEEKNRASGVPSDAGIGSRTCHVHFAGVATGDCLAVPPCNRSGDRSRLEYR